MNTETIVKRLKEIKARAEAATPGEWQYIEDGDLILCSRPNGNGKAQVADICGFGAGLPLTCNGRFIAHSRQDIPLIADLS